MTLYSSCACMVTVLWEVCGSRRGTMHTVEDFHVLVDMCGRTLWSRGHVGPWDPVSIYPTLIYSREGFLQAHLFNETYLFCVRHGGIGNKTQIVLWKRRAQNWDIFFWTFYWILWNGECYSIIFSSEMNICIWLHTKLPISAAYEGSLSTNVLLFKIYSL